MKKLFILSILLVLALVSYGQATPGKIVRIANRTTAMGVNLPIGTQIFCVSDSTLWEVKAAMASTLTLTTGNAVIGLRKTDVAVTRDSDQYNIITDSLKATEATVTLAAATTTYAGVMTAADKVKVDAITTSADATAADTYETATDSLTVSGSGYYTVTLTYTPKDSSAFTVSVNGVELRHAATGQYTVMVPNLAAKRVQFNIPIYKYDVLAVTYSK